MKTKTRKLTYLGRRVIQTETALPGGKRETLNFHVDAADPKNGGHPAGTTTRYVYSGDARKNTLVCHVPEHVVIAGAR